MEATDRQRLIDFFASVSAPTLRVAVREAGLIDEPALDLIRKRMPQDLKAAQQQLSAEIVDRHDDQRRLPNLLHAIGRLVYADDVYRAALAPLIARHCPTDSQHQAALAKRAHTLSLREIAPFCRQIEGNLCVITASRPGEAVRFGTGILVGEDLVLTAFHTLEQHISSNGHQPIAGGRLFAFFEHIGLGAAIDPEAQTPPDVLKVAFHADWLVGSCAHMPDDGKFLHPSDEQKAQLCEHLDFALIRLAEPVGRHTRQFSGGVRRLWWDINKHSGQYLDDERIIIPQHINGLPQRIDFGRYCEAESNYDTSRTRIRYNTETDGGASGAPCFNQRFEFVGLHNAAFRPEGIDLKRNQGIRADRILARLTAITALPSPAAWKAPVPLWSVSNDPARPRPILGRQSLLEWIERSDEDGDASVAYRCYVADADGEKVGRSFSQEILEAARRGQGGEEPVIVLGNGEQIPELAEDFVKSLAHQLRVPQEELDRFPARPSADNAMAPELLAAPVPGEAGFAAGGDLDKLEKWKSEALPDWLGLAMHRHPAAAIAAAADRADGLADDPAADLDDPPAAATGAAAAAPEPPPARQQRVWVVLDNLHSAPLSSDVEDVLAGLMGLNRPQAALPAHLRGMRWLFLGATPRVLLPHRPTVEKLEPQAIGSNEVRAMLEYMMSSNNLPADVTQYLQTALETWLEGDDPRLQYPPQRLQTIQTHLGQLSGKFYKTYGGGARA